MSTTDQRPDSLGRDLSIAEEKLLAAVATSALADLRPSKNMRSNPARGMRWSAARQIRAALLAELVTGTRGNGSNSPRVIKLRGARITGSLDLEAATLTCPLLLLDCFIDEPVELAEATAPAIRIINCHLAGFTARQLHTAGDLWLLDTVFTASSEVRLHGAHIGGQLIMSGTHLTSPGGYALFADGLSVEQDMLCRNGFAAEGEIRLPCARVGGVLDMSGARLANPRGIALLGDMLTVGQSAAFGDGFTAVGQISLNAARIGCQLGMTGAHLANPGGIALDADGLTVGYGMSCADGFTAVGQISLNAARIGGQLDMTGAHLANPGGIALDADGLTVGYGMFCADGFSAEGGIRLEVAHVGGQLDMTGAHLANPGGIALDAESLTVEQHMVLRGGFSAEGEIRLPGARIGGQLSMTGAHLNNPGGRALYADELTVDRSTFCSEGFTVEGEMRMLCARIGGQLDMTGAHLNNPGGRALSATDLTVGQDMFCGDEFTSAGEVSLRGARIRGQLDMTGACLANPGGSALNLEAAEAAALFLLPRQPPDGDVCLAEAKVGRFYDDPARWPASFDLGGFEYGAFGGARVSTRRRLGWLARHQGGYVPQLYDQLADVYRRAGDEKAARKAVIAKQRRRRDPYSPLSWLWYLTVGYGYRPWLAGAWVIALAALGTAVFSHAYPAHMIAISPHPPAFHAAAYALDLLLPVIGLGQKSAWQPQGTAYLYWSWALTGAGWVLAIALIAGLTGILKRD